MSARIARSDMEVDGEHEAMQQPESHSESDSEAAADEVEKEEEEEQDEEDEEDEDEDEEDDDNDEDDTEREYDPPLLPCETHESYLRRLVPLVLSSGAAEQAHGTRGLLQLLLTSKPAIQGAIDAGLVARLLQLCKEARDDEIQLNCVWSLATISSGKKSYAAFLLAADALPVLVAMMGSPNDQVNRYAVLTIGNIAWVSVQFRDRVLAAGALPPIVALGTRAAARARDDDSDIPMLRTISWTFETILGEDPLPEWPIIQSITPVLARLLECSDEKTMTQTCGAISSLSEGQSQRLSAIIETGAVPRLVQLLLHAKQEVLTPVLNTLSNIIGDKQKHAQVVLDCADAVPNLRKLLTHKIRSVRQNACLVISNIATGNRDQIEVVLKADVISVLLDRLRDAKSMEEAAWTITNAIFGGTEAQIRYIISQGVLQPLCKLFTSTNKHLVLAALESIDSILRIGAADARASGAPINALAREVESCGGLASLASLRFPSIVKDENERVHKAAERLLLTHFNGYALPDQVHPLKALPTPFDDAARHPPRTLRELDMTRVMGAIKEKPDWYSKVNSNEITAKWTAEAAAQFPSLTPASLEWCIEELRYQSSRRVGPIQHSAIDGIWQADGLIDSELKAALLAGLSRLASVPADQLDWHPGTNQQVLDIVHPSMYCYRIGESRVTEQRFGVAEAIDMIGQGVPRPAETAEKPSKSTPHQSDNDDEDDNEDGGDNDDQDTDTSSRFQWLPAEFRVGDDGGVTVESYINNLHPVEEAALYPVIGAIFARFVPMFERVLAHLRTPTDLRIIPNPRRWYKKPVAPGAQEDGSEEEPDDEADDYLETRPIYIPDVDQFYPIDAAASRRVTLAGRRLQVIVKVARIYLTPESPTYAGGSWHVEGMRNESIVASGIYYFASENVSESRLAFRQAVTELTYEQNDDRGIRLVYGLENEGSLNQVLGSVITCADRCIAFPNIYQHQVQPFHLTDATRTGHRSILAFLLVDPSIETVSGAVVPPQQANWVRTAVPPDAALGVMTRRQAEEHRDQLMKERTQVRP